MPKIKSLSNGQLKDYLDAYQENLQSDPKNSTYQRKIKCINEALHKRELINFDLDKTIVKPGIFKRIFSIFKKKK